MQNLASQLTGKSRLAALQPCPLFRQGASRSTTSVRFVQRNADAQVSMRPDTPKRRSHSFFYFDPEDPENVVEVKASGASSKAEIVASVHRSKSLVLSTSDAFLGQDAGMSLASGGSYDGPSSTALSKSTAMQAELLIQLEQERGKVMELSQYESMFKEWRVRAQSANAELSLLQRTLADKDAELASAYKRLENAAAERTALRKHSVTLEEETRALKAIVEEIRPALGPGTTSSNVVPMGNGNGNGPPRFGAAAWWDHSTSSNNGSSSN